MRLKKVVFIITSMIIIFSIQLGLDINKVFAKDNWIVNDQIVCSKDADVNGDGVEEKVILSSHYSFGKDIEHIKGFKLTISNKDNTKTIAEKEILENRETYTIWSGEILIGDINNDEIPEILTKIGMPTCYGTDYLYEMYSLKNNKLIEVSTKAIKDNKGLKCEKISADIVKISAENMGEQVPLHLSEFQELLFKNSKKPANFRFDISGMTFSEGDRSGVYELDIYRRLSTDASYQFPYINEGIREEYYDFNWLADIRTTYRYIDSEWQMVWINIYPHVQEIFKEDKIKHSLSYDDLAIGKFKLDKTYEYFVNTFGEPDSDYVKNSSDRSTPSYIKYNGVTIWFSPEGFSIQIYIDEWTIDQRKEISCYSEQCTPRGLKMGDSLQRTADLYGHDCSRGRTYWTSDLKKQMLIAFDDNCNVTGIYITNR